MLENSKVEFETIGNLKYVKWCDFCNSCEFVPPCRLCTWVNRKEIDNALNNDHGIIFDRKFHIEKKEKKMKKLRKLYEENDIIVL